MSAFMFLLNQWIMTFNNKVITDTQCYNVFRVDYIYLYDTLIKISNINVSMYVHILSMSYDIKNEVIA